MMQQNSAFSSMLRKTFDSALEYLLYTEYRFLGGKRVITMIVNDVKGLIDSVGKVHNFLKFAQFDHCT